MRVTKSGYRQSITGGDVIIEDKTMIKVNAHSAHVIVAELWRSLQSRLIPDVRLERLTDYRYQQRQPQPNGTDYICDIELLCNNAERRRMVADIFAVKFRQENGTPHPSK